MKWRGGGKDTDGKRKLNGVLLSRLAEEGKGVVGVL